LDLEVIDAATANPLQSFLGLGIIDEPEFPYALLTALALRTASWILSVFNPKPLEFGLLEILLVVAVSEKFGQQYFSRQSHYFIY
jgi:hypothetical protein